MGKYFLVSIFAAVCFAGCNKKNEEPAAQPEDVASQVGVSTSGVIGQTLNAPGNYARTLAGSLEKAKNTADMVNKKTEEREAMDEQYRAGGN